MLHKHMIIYFVSLFMRLLPCRTLVGNILALPGFTRKPHELQQFLMEVGSGKSEVGIYRFYGFFSAFRFPLSDFRFPTSAFRLPLSDFRFPLSDFRFSMRNFCMNRLTIYLNLISRQI